MANALEWLFSPAAWWVWTILAAGVVTVLYMGRHSSFALTDLGYTFPLVGKLARYSRDYSESSYPGWLNVEITLCRDYAKHMSALSKEQFDNQVLYLKKTYDHGRRRMPALAMVLLGTLIVLEGLGFSYLLGSLMAAEGSENVRELLMVAVVIVLATILVWATHEAGHQLFRTGLLRNCFREFQTCGKGTYSSRIVGLDENQMTDDEDPEHVQCANRVISKPGDRGGYSWVWIAGVLIFAIAVGSTELRVQSLRATEADDARAAPAAMFGSAPATPATPAAPDPAIDARDNAAMTGFTMLAVIFVITQIVGVSIGYRYGFAGKQSDEAWRATNGAADYSSYWQPIQRRMNLANTRLSSLHRMLEKYSPRRLEFEHSFLDFIRDERERGAQDLHEPPDSTTPRLALPAPAVEQDETALPADAAPAPAPPGVDRLEEALLQWDDAPTSAAKADCYETLSEEMRAQLRARLRDRKAHAEADHEHRREQRAAIEREVEELL